MNSPTVKVAAQITGLAPQFLVDDLPVAVEYYEQKLGFTVDFVYESFYASVSRDGFAIHLKCAPKTVSDRAHRKLNEHLDVYIGVRGVDSLFEEFESSGARIMRRLEQREWGCKDFYIEDPDGYILCFSEETA